MDRFLGKVRPQILAAILGLLALGLYSLRLDHIEVTSLCGAGVIALAKDVLQSDNN
jgi:hypothetical protein